MKQTLFVFAIIMSSTCWSQKIASGPMVGYSTMREVGVWVQTDKKAEIRLLFWPKGSHAKPKTSPVVKTNRDHGFTAHLVAELLEPGTEYEFAISIDEKVVKPKFQQHFKTQALWQSRTDAPDFTFVAGSCMYINEESYDRPGSPYGGDYQIFHHIAKEQPDFMVWLGDNTYTREVDWDSRSGIYHRYSHTRANPELQEILPIMHHYAVWDDHDYGPNDSDRQYWNKDITKQAFVDFWNNQNIGVGGSEGVTSTFSWSDCQYFMVDNRWYRTSAIMDDRHIIGEPQLTWLKESLLYSKSTFKFICIGGQFINDAAVFENHATYPEERQDLIDFIDKNQIKNVVFFTGDRHHSEISLLTTQNGINIFDITSSALTSGSAPHYDEQNHQRIPGSMIGQRNYALVKISGTPMERKLTVHFKDSNGNSLYHYDIISQ